MTSGGISFTSEKTRCPILTIHTGDRTEVVDYHPLQSRTMSHR